jgi:hypothetical protein
VISKDPGGDLATPSVDAGCTMVTKGRREVKKLQNPKTVAKPTINLYLMQSFFFS